MAYQDPRTVKSPKAGIRHLNVLYDGGEQVGEGGHGYGGGWLGWSIAEFEWYEEPVLAIRWNGSSENPDVSGIGNPQSRGVPTWFILPDALADTVRAVFKFHVIFHPMSVGVSPGNRGPRGEVESWYPTKEAAIDGTGKPPLSGYIAVKVLDEHGDIVWEQTAGQHIAQAELRA